jgi:hypothetical protein
VLKSYAKQWPQLRYYREHVNSGVDADYDKAVGYANGRHVWLMTDDDLLVPGAIARVCELLRSEDPDLMMVDAEVRDLGLEYLLQARRFGFAGMRHYARADADALLVDAGDALSFIGGTILRRSLWEARDRKTYYGSLFIHVGVIFQAPIEKAILLGEPLIQIRFGNAMWSARGFEIWMFKWPDLIWSFDGFSPKAKAKITPAKPWRIPRKMLGYRANGSYSLREYRLFFTDRQVGPWRLGLIAFALLPGQLANVLALTLLLASAGRYRGACFTLGWNSRFAGPLSKKLAALSYRRHPA